MNKKSRSNPTYQALRKKAEQIVAGKQIDSENINNLDLMSLIHEVEIQHVELELQNQELRMALRDLEVSRNKFFELYQTAPVAFVTVTENGQIEQVNSAAAQLLSKKDTYLIGRSFVTLIAPEHHLTYFAFLKDQALRQSAGCCELCLKSNSGIAVYIHLEAHALYNDEGKHYQWRFGIIDISKLKQVEIQLRSARNELEKNVAHRTAELNKRNKQLGRLTIELTLAEQRERQRLADLLHDHLQQFLAGARINLEMASKTKGASQDSALKNAYELVSQSLKTSRTLSAELSPPVLYIHGLIEAFNWLARWMKKTHHLQIELKAEAEAEPVQEEVKILLFQSVRELLFNVVKHAGIQSAQVEMKKSDNDIEIIVSDKGLGFDTQRLWQDDQPAGNSYGLFNIRERLLLLGGDFDIQSSSEKGTIVRIKTPLQTPAFNLPRQKLNPHTIEYSSNPSINPSSPKGPTKPIHE